MSGAAIDVATFRRLQEAAGAEFVAELLDAFYEEAPRIVSDMRAAMAARDAEKFRRAAHSLKSNANTFGALALGALARELELAGLDGALAGNAPTVDALQREYALAVRDLMELSRG